MMNPKIFIITVNWNSFLDVSVCLESLRKVDYPNFRVIVVDNGSTDDSLKRIRELYPEVILIAHAENLGLAAANNSGIRYGLKDGMDFGLILNNDAVVDSQILKIFIQAAHDHPKAGIFGARIFYLSSPDRIWWAKPQWNPETGEFFNEGHDQIEDPQNPLLPGEIAYANGCALFFRREVAETIGLMDERFFIYFEEIDWCWRARSAGFQIRFEPQAKVWHKVAASSGGRRSPVMTYFETRNKFLWASRNLSRSERRRFCGKLIRSFLSSTFYSKETLLAKRIYWDLRHLMSSHGKAKLRGLLDYVCGRFGNCPPWIRRLPSPPIFSLRKKILLIVKGFYFPLRNGGQMRTWNFIRALAPEHDLFLLNIYEEPMEPRFDEKDCAAKFQRTWQGRKRPDNGYGLSLRQRISKFIRGIPWELNPDGQPEITDELARAFSQAPFDYVLVRYLAQAQYLEKYRGRLREKIILDLDDLETQKIFPLTAIEGYRDLYDLWRKRLNLWIYERYHKSFLRQVACTIVCSEKDRQYLLKNDWTKKITVIANALDLDTISLTSRRFPSAAKASPALSGEGEAVAVSVPSQPFNFPRDQGLEPLEDASGQPPSTFTLASNEGTPRERFGNLVGSINENKTKEILFVGSLFYKPNWEGIVWFAEKIFPNILLKEPEARLVIVGCRPRPEVIALSRQEAITLYADVDDLSTFYQRSSLVIVPIRIAGGTRIKILEAALFQRPVVTTTIGAQGLEMVANKHCLVADSEDGFAQACLRLLREPSLTARLVQENAHLVRSLYSYSTAKKKILEIFNGCLKAGAA